MRKIFFALVFLSLMLMAWALIKPAYGLIPEAGEKYLVNKAARIVVGKVEAMESRWNSEHSMIYTYVTIGVDEHVKGKPETKEVIVKVEGGEVGDDYVWVEDTPDFEQGERVLLFLRAVGEGYFFIIGVTIMLKER